MLAAYTGRVPEPGPGWLLSSWVAIIVRGACLSPLVHCAACLLGLLPAQDGYRNQGGFNMIGSGRDKIETKEELAAGGAPGLRRVKPLKVGPQDKIETKRGLAHLCTHLCTRQNGWSSCRAGPGTWAGGQLTNRAASSAYSPSCV